MELLMQRWFSGPLGNALVRLLNMSAAAGVLILVVVLLRLLLRRAPKWTRGILWVIVAVQLVCPVSLRSPLSVYRLLPRSDGVTSDQVEVFRAGGGSEKPLLILDTPQIAGYEAGAVAERPALPASAPPQPAVPSGPAVYLPAAGAVWLAGFALMLLYALASWLLLRRRVRASVPLDDARFRICNSIETPFILGVLRPRVYLPSGLNDAQRTAVTAHETAHLRRGDHWWKMLGWLLLAVHWFNPLVWLAYVLLCRDIELACDEKAVRGMDSAERADYSQALLDCAAPRALLRVCPLAFGEVGVKERIKAVLNYKKPAFWIIVAAVIVCVVVGVCFLTRPGPIKVPAPSDAAVTPTPYPTPFEPIPTGAPTGPTPVDFSNGTTYYLDPAWDENAYGPLGGFTITLDAESGLFQLYESPLSSYKGLGSFQLRDGILTLREVAAETARVNRFRMEDDRLIWLEEGSDNFHFVTLTDGAVFSTTRPVTALRSGVYEGAAFSIRIDAETGSFFYNEAPYSSHLSNGLYRLEGNVLTLDDAWPTVSGQPAIRSNRFLVEEDQLVWLEDGSDNFVFVTLSDGAAFRYQNDSSAALRRMTLDDVRTMAKKGDALTWADLEPYAGDDIGSGVYLYRFPIDEDYCLEVSDGKLSGAPQRVMLIRADESGEFYAVGKRCIDIRIYDVDAFLSMPQEAYLTVTSAGQSIAAMPHLLYERQWNRDAHDWISGDGMALQSLTSQAAILPTLTLADDFALTFGGGAVRNGALTVFDEDFVPLKENYYGDTAVNWLAPGSYFCGVKVSSNQGRYVREAGGWEDCACLCVFRLIVPEGDRPAPFAPAEARGLVEAELHIAGSVHTLTDAGALAQLERWLSGATELPSTGCPFSSLLILTCADGRQFSLCPAEDSCGTVFADGSYYRYAADNAEFWRMFGVVLG